MPRTKKSGKRSDSDYLSTAKTLREFVPSLSKYGRRKKLTRWEKAAITRAQKNVNRAARGGTLVSLSKKQVKSLDQKTRGVLVGHGIRAVRLRNFDPKRDKFGVEKGRIKTHRRGSRRTWHYEHIPFLGEVETIRLIADKVLDILSRHKGKEVDFQIWTGAGRISIGAGALFGDESEDEAIGILTGFVSQYAGISPQFEEWFLGIAWSVEKRGA